MYRAGRGELDERIARTIAAIDHGEHLRDVDAGLARDEHALRAMLGAIELAIVMREQSADKPALGRLWSLLRGQRRDERIATLVEQADRAILSAALEQLEQLRDQRRAVRAEIARVADAAAHLDRLFAEKESWLERIGAPSAAEALALAERIGHQEAVRHCHEVARSAGDPAGVRRPEGSAQQ